MSYDEIKLDYGLAEEMAQTFRAGVEQLEGTMQEMQSIANTLDDGALRGQGGSAFVDAVRSKLCPSLSRLTEKFDELEKDVLAAIEYMREADAASKGMF
ncbi:MAG: WXG100 family type VII secretion target [Chloroflexaceae bacterium]|nr:WXG100 family type VII secretion target [Chloroflexaceae bacterium]